MSDRDFIALIHFLFLFYFQIYGLEELIDLFSLQRFQSLMLFLFLFE